MMQFFETYQRSPKLSPLVAELTWSHNLMILSRCKSEEEPLQVGRRDFALDLLFFNRALNCLVALELKIDEFQPGHLGQLEFYLEALDRDVRKPHEGPSIGVLLCATKDSEVVEYALSRAMSPALVAEYQTRLPDKMLLQAKLHEFYELGASRRQRPPSRRRRRAHAERRRLEGAAGSDQNLLAVVSTLRGYARPRGTCRELASGTAGGEAAARAADAAFAGRVLGRPRRSGPHRVGSARDIERRARRRGGRGHRSSASSAGRTCARNSAAASTCRLMGGCSPGSALLLEPGDRRMS